MTLSWPIIERIPVVGDVAVSPHGLFTALGILAGAMVLRRRAERWGLGRDVEDVGDELWQVLTPVLIAAVVGARGFYVLRHWDDFASRPLAALAAWEGGLTLLGGITAGVLTAAIVLRRRGHDARRVLDMAAPGLALGIAIGRIGDLLIGDHIGARAANTLAAWQCTGNLWDRSANALDRIAPLPYPAAGAPTAGCFDTPVVQTALLDAIAAAAATVVVLVVARRLGAPGRGLEAATFVLAYGSGRLVLDSLRQDQRVVGLTASQWTALVAILAVVVWLAVRRPWRSSADALATERRR